MMDREDSHSRTSTSRYSNPQNSRSRSCSSSESYASPPLRLSIIQRNLSDLSSSELLLFAKQLEHPGITALRFYVSPADPKTVSWRFLDDQNLCAFTRALANAVEGWMQSLELGMCLNSSDIDSLCPAIRYSKTLRHLSFANSSLGDDMLQILSSALENCLPLRTLNLSGCGLTDASSSAIAAIVKGQDLPKCREVSPSSTAEHRQAPKYGQQWRQSVILMGKWAPPSPSVTAGSKSRDSPPPPAHVNSGLVALDVSCNHFSDALTLQLCPVLHKKAALRALNLRCNRMTRLGAKVVLDVMKQAHVLRVVDMRCNKDGGLMGVLENGEHYTTFSTFQAPFWMDPESLNPVVCKPKKKKKRLRPAAHSRPKSMSTQRVGNIRNHSKTSPDFVNLEPPQEHPRSQSAASGFHNYYQRITRAAPESRYNHHRCKLLNDVREQKHKRIHDVVAPTSKPRSNTPPQILLQPASVPDENLKELVEWNNFVNQMTNTLLNLKGADGIGPREGAFAEVAQQAATKLHQMPSFGMFSSGMLRQLDRSCRHVASLAKRRRDLTQLKRQSGTVYTENEAPVCFCDERTTKDSAEQATIDHQDVAENQKASRNHEPPKVPSLSMSKGTNIPGSP